MYVCTCHINKEKGDIVLHAYKTHLCGMTLILLGRGHTPDCWRGSVLMWTTASVRI